MQIVIDPSTSGTVNTSPMNIYDNKTQKATCNGQNAVTVLALRYRVHQFLSVNATMLFSNIK